MAEHVKRLRECVLAGKKIDMDEMNVIMDGQKVPRNALTNFMISQTDAKAEKKFYTVEAVWNALKCKDYRVREYVTFCNEKNIARVFEPDRGDITKYLMGVENFQQIKQLASGDAVKEAVVRRPRATDPSQQEMPVDEASAAARAVWNGLLQKLWEQSANPKKYGEPTDVDVDLKECEPLFAASKVVAQNICQNEKCTPDRSTWGCAPGCNFQSTVVKWFKAAKEESERAERDPKRGRVDAAAAGAAQKRAARFKEPPIILLPRSDSAVINMRNGLDFFEKGVFVSQPEDFSQAPPVQFNVTHNGLVFTFKDMMACTMTEWLERVVAVVVMGNTWQFKEFHSREPTDVFGAVKGYYVRYIEDIPDACVKSWNVQHIGLSRKSRHLDRVAQKQIWEGVIEQARRKQLL